MTPVEQYRRFGCVLTDCALARKANADARAEFWRDIRQAAANAIIGIGMGACIVGVVFAVVRFGSFGG